MDDAVTANREFWDTVTPGHVASEFYDVASFRTGRDTIDDVAARLVGDMAGRTLLHLQCHFGLDTMSWSRRGARATGLDFSEVAIHAAQRLAAELDLDTRFVVGQILDADLGEEFDIVFTSHGVLGWLPELESWGQTVARHLAQGGHFVLVEHHPVLMTFDDERTDGEMRLAYDYFSSQRLEWTEAGTYADAGAPEMTTIERLHRLDEIVGALIGAGLTITALEEYDKVAWQALPHLVQTDDGWWRQPDGDIRVPLMIGITATK